MNAHASLAAAVAVALAAGWTTTASAQRSPDDRAIDAALVYWQAMPSCGRPTIRYAAYEEIAGRGLDGTIDPATCTVVLDGDRRPSARERGWAIGFLWAGLCDTTTHEVGHLLGWGHDAAAGVMHHNRSARPQVCLDEFLPPPWWARVTVGIRRQYQKEGPVVARAAYRRWRRRHASRVVVVQH